jgi:hypothetical protein
MKEERGVIGTAQPEAESRIRKYMRIALVSIGMALFLAVIVMAALRRYGG